MRKLWRRIVRWWYRRWNPPPFTRTEQGHYISPEGVPYEIGAEPVGGQQDAVRVVLYHAWEPVIPHTRIPGLEDIVDADAGTIRQCIRRLLAEADRLSARYEEALEDFEAVPGGEQRTALTDEERERVADAVVDRLSEATQPTEG